MDQTGNINGPAEIKEKTWKEENSLEKRIHLAQKIREAYPDRVPVIVERMPKSDAPAISKKKFLAPGDITVAKFSAEIRKHMTLPSNKALFLFINNKSLPQSGELMAAVYERHKDEDGFLYIMYSGETTFGGEQC